MDHITVNKIKGKISSKIKQTYGKQLSSLSIQDLPVVRVTKHEGGIFKVLDGYLKGVGEQLFL